MSGRSMSRQAGKIGIVGIIFLAVAGYGGYVASDTIAAYWQWYKLRRDTLDIARFSRGIEIPKIQADVMAAAKKLGIPNITPPKITREAHTDARTRIIYQYSRELDLKQFGKKQHVFVVTVEQGMPMVEGQM